MISGHLKETIMRVYDVRPSTAEFMMDALEKIIQATKNEYHRGWIEGEEALREEQREDGRERLNQKTSGD